MNEKSSHLGTPDYLITGASGWVGQRLVRYLYDALCQVTPVDARIRCLIQPGQDSQLFRALESRVEVIEGDLRDPTMGIRFCENANNAVLIHTAGVIHPRRVTEFHEVNVMGTENLLAAASLAGVRRAVVISSNSPIGCNPFREHEFDEDSPYHPYQGYGRSKMLMEKMVNRFSAEGRIETVILRPPWFYGPWQPARQTLFFSMIRSGKMPILGDGENRRSMVYIDNLCQGICRASLRPQAAARTYWIADRQSYSMNDIVTTIARLLEEEFHLPVKRTPIHLPNLVGDVAGFIDSALQFAGIYHQKIHVLSEMNRTIACSIARAESELGYNPDVSLEEGMRRSIKWCLSEGINL